MKYSIIREVSIVGCLILCVTGCSSTTIRNISISSKPKAAEVKITADQSGPRGFVVGKTPTSHAFTFGVTPEYGPSMYNVEIGKEGYEAETVRIKKDDYRNSIDVKLNREVVREVTRFEDVISDEGYTIVPRTVRAWIEDIERDVAAASSIVRLGANQSILGMTLSPDGNTLAFSLAERVEDARGNEKTIANLRAVQSKGGGITQITTGKWVDANPVYSVAEKALFFNSNRMRRNRSDIFRIAAKRTSGIAVIRQTVEGFNYQPATGKDIVAFTYKPMYQGRIPGTEQIWSIGGENGYPTQLREGSMPALSPDGTTVAFIGPAKQLWKMPVTGLNPVQLTSTAINLEGKKNPAWSPDGEQIVFAADDGKDSRNVANYDIWIIHESGRSLRQLTTNGSLDDFPVVSPDKKFIYFVSNRGFKEGIWRIPFPQSSK